MTILWSPRTTIRRELFLHVSPRWLLGAGLALATACGSSDSNEPSPGAGGTSGAAGATTAGAAGTTTAGSGGANAGAGGASAAGAGGGSAGQGGTNAGAGGSAAGAAGSTAGAAGAAPLVCPGSYFCDDFENPAWSIEAWKPVGSAQFTFPTFVASPTSHGGTRVMHAEASKPEGGENSYNVAFRGIGTVEAKPAAVTFAFRLLQGDSTQQLLQFDAFDDAALKSGFELQLQVDGKGTVKMNVVDFNPSAKPGYSTVNLGTAPVGAWTTVALLIDFTGATPGVRGSINGGAPGDVLPFVPQPTTDSPAYRLEMTMGTFSILGGTNAVDIDDVDVRPR